MSEVQDKELRIIGDCVRLLEQLDPQEQERTITYLARRFPMYGLAGAAQGGLPNMALGQRQR